MVDITEQQVADALHTDVAELPTGASADITAAEELVSTTVEPYADGSEQNLVQQTAIFVACAFIEGTEGDKDISSISRQSTSITFEKDSADEASDFWTRALKMDPTGRLDSDTVGFEVL